jgi:hypothetical protein
VADLRCRSDRVVQEGLDAGIEGGPGPGGVVIDRWAHGQRRPGAVGEETREPLDEVAHHVARNPAIARCRALPGRVGDLVHPLGEPASHPAIPPGDLAHRVLDSSTMPGVEPSPLGVACGRRRQDWTLMRRLVSCRLEAVVAEATDVALSVAVAHGPRLDHESLVVTLDGKVVPVREVADDHGTRLHLADGVRPGHLAVAYEATAVGRADAAPVADIDPTRYRRASRYCESDRLTAFARAEFRDLRGLPLLEAVSSWVGQRVAYVTGWSRPTDGAVSTLLARQGVCRDFAHLVIALLRGCDVPARLVSVYAPGLQPMDFHAVAEALVGGRWLVTDATCLAPRSTLVRIATGRDAADTAFLTTTGASVELTSLEVLATSDGPLPDDDLRQPVQLV